MKYLIYDLETVPNLGLFRDVKHPGLMIAEALENFWEEKGDKNAMIPVSFHEPVSCVTLALEADFSPSGELVTLASPHVATHFWATVEAMEPILVDFNGRRFDLPVLTLAAFRERLSVPHYFNAGRYSYRYRYTDKHIDLMDWVTSHGAFALTGGLDLMSRLAGGSGKLEGTSGADVQRLHEEGKLDEIHRYCRFDVIETYRVFLRTRVLTGELTGAREAELMERFK